MLRRRVRTTPKFAELVASGVKPVRLVYADGGQNPAFAGYKDSSDPDALASGPQEIVLSDLPKPVPAAVKVAAADAAKQRAASAAPESVEALAADTAGPGDVAVALAPSAVRRHAWRVERRRPEREEMAASWRPGAGAAACRGLCARSADSVRRAAAAASRRSRLSGREFGASGVAACPAETAGEAKQRRNGAGRSQLASDDVGALRLASSAIARHPARPARRKFPIRTERRETRRAASSASASARVGTTIGAPSRGHT